MKITHERPSNHFSGITTQAWFTLAFWLGFGLLMEGLIGFRSPAYLQDPVRREVFRLAHAHGTILSLLLLIASLYLCKDLVSPPRLSILSLRIGALLMPVGFLLGGIWHYESDPGPGIFLVPVGGLMIIFGVIAFGLSGQNK